MLVELNVLTARVKFIEGEAEDLSEHVQIAQIKVFNVCGLIASGIKHFKEHHVQFTVLMDEVIVVKDEWTVLKKKTEKELDHNAKIVDNVKLSSTTN
jgi:hypothetical protein